MVIHDIIRLKMMKLPKECQCDMDKYPSTYDRVKQFIENELHINLTFYQDMVLKYLLDEQVQERLKQLYKSE